MKKPKKDLQLIIVSFNTKQSEVEELAKCLKKLKSNIGYSIIVNDYKNGQPIGILEKNAEVFIALKKNLGYGQAVNLGASMLRKVKVDQEIATSEWIAALNTDISWKEGSFEKLVQWLNNKSEVVLVVPQIKNTKGEIERLCKRNPTIIALISRRFIPDKIKPKWLNKIDNNYIMGNMNLDSEFDVEYLSGCCMFIRRSAFDEVGGFDARYFLYLEDADITRSLTNIGRCIHTPQIQIVHKWARGNHSSLRLTLVNIISSIKYFQKWGWHFW